MGNRVAKKIVGNNGEAISVTYYIRDAQGNVMATYQRGYAGEAQYMKLEELHIYGSQRLGMRTKPVHVNEGSVEGGLIDMLSQSWHTKSAILTRGDKRYELTNHLGNVLMVITDRKLLFSREGVRYFTADQVSFTDYYPFGLEMRDVAAMGNSTEDRYWVREEEGSYKYGFNSKEKEIEVLRNGYDFGARLLNTRLGKWLSIDVLTTKHANLTPYCFVQNLPTIMKDPDGNDAIVTIDGNTITVKAQIFIYGEKATNKLAMKIQKAIMQTWNQGLTYTEGDKTYTVKFEVEVVNINPQTGALAKDVAEGNTPSLWNGDENWVEIKDESNEEFRSNVSSETGQNGEWGSDESDLVYAHEFGHLLGLADAYVELKWNPKAADAFGISKSKREETITRQFESAPKNELMGTGDTVSQKDIDAIISVALKLLNSGKKELEAKGMPLNKPTNADYMPYLGSGQYDLIDTE